MNKRRRTENGPLRIMSGPLRNTVGPGAAFRRASRPMYRRSGTGFNQGYTIHNRKAVNTKKRRRYVPRSQRIRRMRYKKSALAGIAGKLMEKVRKRYVQLNEMEVERGSILLPNGNNSSGDIALPLHLFDITNVSYNSDVISHQLWYNSTDDNPSAISDPQYYFTSSLYTKFNSDGESGGSNNVYSAGTTEMSASTRCPQGANDARKWYMHGANIDLMMYGQDNADTLYRVDIVKFDQEFAKMISSNVAASQGLSGAGVGYTAGDWKTFWHALVSPYTQNPMIRRYRGKYMKILKSYKFKIPEQSLDFNRIPSVKTKIRFNVNRVLDRYWHTNMDINDFTANVNPESATALNREDYGAYNADQYGNGKVRPKDRIFLMIRATNTDNRSTEADGTFLVGKGEDPTYDINIRTEFSFNPT